MRLFIWVSVLLVALFNLVNFVWSRSLLLPPSDRMVIAVTACAYVLMVFVVGIASDRVYEHGKAVLKK